MTKSPSVKKEEVKLTKQDQKLVDDSIQKIQTIFTDHFSSALLETANYIAETFFNNDIELVRKKTPYKTKAASFRQLCRQLVKNGSRTPSQAWLYNALGVFVDNHDLESFHTYRNLSVSHKVKLLTVHGIENKKKLAEEIVDKNLSVRGLQERIIEVRKEDPKYKDKGDDKYLKNLKKFESYLSNWQKEMEPFKEIEKDNTNYKELNHTLDQLFLDIIACIAHKEAENKTQKAST